MTKNFEIRVTFSEGYSSRDYGKISTTQPHLSPPPVVPLQTCRLMNGFPPQPRYSKSATYPLCTFYFHVFLIRARGMAEKNKSGRGFVHPKWRQGHPSQLIEHQTRRDVTASAGCGAKASLRDATIEGAGWVETDGRNASAVSYRGTLIRGTRGGMEDKRRVPGSLGSGPVGKKDVQGGWEWKFGSFRWWVRLFSMWSNLLNFKIIPLIQLRTRETMGFIGVVKVL